MQMQVISAIVGGLFLVAIVLFIVAQIRGIVRDYKKRKELLNRSNEADGINERKE